MIKTDVLVIGAGATGLFAVFEAGLLKLKCHILDALPQVGGHLSDEESIYDIPGFSEVLDGNLIDELMEQIKQFEPGFTLGECVETIEKQEDGTFIVTSNRGTKFHTPIIAIVKDRGDFESYKLFVEEIEFYEDKGVKYFVENPEKFKDKRIVIADEGDLTLWTILLVNVASEIRLIQRANEFREALQAVKKIQELKSTEKNKLITSAEVIKEDLNQMVENLSKYRKMLKNNFEEKVKRMNEITSSLKK